MKQIYFSKEFFASINFFAFVFFVSDFSTPKRRASTFTMDMNVINTTEERPVAVRVRDAYKRFSVSNVILHGLNMTVPEGTV